MLKHLYGHEVKSADDEYLHVITTAVEETMSSSAPGASLVDFVPIRKCMTLFVDEYALNAWCSPISPNLVPWRTIQETCCGSQKHGEDGSSHDVQTGGEQFCRPFRLTLSW